MAWGHCPGASAVWPPHQCYCCSKTADAESSDEKEILAGCKIQTSQKRGSRIKVHLQKPMFLLYLNQMSPLIRDSKAEWKHSSFTIAWNTASHIWFLRTDHFSWGGGTWTATDTSCLVQTDQPKGSSGQTHTHTHTHYQQHVMGFSARKSNSLSHLPSLFFKDQSYAHSWSLCESCLIN